MVDSAGTRQDQNDDGQRRYHAMTVGQLRERLAAFPANVAVLVHADDVDGHMVFAELKSVDIEETCDGSTVVRLAADDTEDDPS